MVGNGFKEGETLFLRRRSLLNEPLDVLLEGLDGSPRAMVLFIRTLAEDLNIAGVAMLGIKLSGIYTH